MRNSISSISSCPIIIITVWSLELLSYFVQVTSQIWILKKCISFSAATHKPPTKHSTQDKVYALRISALVVTIDKTDFFAFCAIPSGLQISIQIGSIVCTITKLGKRVLSGGHASNALNLWYTRFAVKVRRLLYRFGWRTYTLKCNKWDEMVYI